MGSTYFPTKKGIDPEPQVGHPPASIRMGGPDAAAPGSFEVLTNNSAAIDAWISAQRQNVANSTIEYYRATLTTPDVDVHYTNNHGHEIIRMDPRPKKGQVGEQPKEKFTKPAIPKIPEPEIPQVPAPHTYLMVLYKTTLTASQPEHAKGDGIAAFPMDSLTPTGCGSPTYTGVAKDCEWVEQVGEIVQVGQYTFNGVGWISTQLDFTGQHRATGVWVSTTGLFDAIATPADIQAPLAMNAGANKDAGVITAGGQVFLNPTTKQLNIGGTWASVSGVTLPPYAIDTDSTGYFFTLFQGDAVHLSLDPKSNLFFLPDPDFNNAVNNKLNDLHGKIPDPQISYVTRSIVTDVTSGSHIHDEYNYRITILMWGDQVLTCHLDGISYYGTAKPGTLPAYQNLKVAESETDVEAYDESVNHTVIKTIPVHEGNSSDFGGHFPIPTYQLGGGTKGSDNVYVSFAPITATGSTDRRLTLKTDKDAFTSMLGPSQATAGAQTFDGTTQTTYGAGVGFMDTFVSTPSNYFFGDAAAFDGWYAGNLGAALAYPEVKSSHVYDMVPLIVDGGSSTAATITAEFASSEDAPFPAGCVIVSSSGSDGSHTGGACDEHFPYRCGSTENLYHVNGDIEAWGVSISFHQTHDPILGTLNHAEPPGMTAHAHPPAFTKTGAVIEPYYTFVLPDQTGGSGPRVITIHTPYGEYQGKNDLSFTPWLHLSNGSHCIQAYYVDDQPYAFVDGSNKPGFLDAIAKALKCDVTEIVAMYMDVSLQTVKAVANVQPPDYSTSQIPPPGVPGS